MDAISNGGSEDFVDDDNSFGAPDRADGRELMLEFFNGPSTQPTFLPTGGPDGSGALEFDGDVDGQDFLMWQQGFGDQFDTSDLADWWDHFGEGVGAAVAAATVPEPTTALLMLSGYCVLGMARTRKNHPQ